ncbi:MAG: hypothetical protein U0835_01335 [Isosphaeraceae bacterium]
MDSPSFDSTRPAETTAVADAGARARAVGEAVLIAGFGNGVAADYANFLAEHARAKPVLVADGAVRRLAGPGVNTFSLEEASRAETGRLAGLVLFVGARLSSRQRRELDAVLDLARSRGAGHVTVVSSFRVHIRDTAAAALEADVVSRVKALTDRYVVFRPGHVLSPNSGVNRFLHRFASLHPATTPCLATCFLDGPELFEAIEAERNDEPSHEKGEPYAGAGRVLRRNIRVFTLLGPHVRWREMLARRAAPGGSAVSVLARVLSWVFLDHLFAFFLRTSARILPAVRQWNVHTIRPGTLRELLALCHRRNIGHVKVVGYNNGVVHFGHRHPGKTVVSTVRCARTASAGGDLLKADSGATIRGALDFLYGRGRELYVVPNYSYVCLGTAFYVPIHGSAVGYSTVADTVRRVVLYDPERDRVVSAGRDDVDFAENVYNLRSNAVVLRLYLLTRPKSGYYVRRETWDDPSAEKVLEALRDKAATNVEIRQAHSASRKVTVSRYYTDPGDSSSPALELPRDALGRLWDRLEENPVTSFLMHATSRHVAWHTELFFTAQEFEVFWRTRAQVSLRKIQLRYIGRDRMPHSPFRDEDRVSADLFMFRTEHKRFLEYLRTTLPAVRTNPGKHSH